MPKGFEKIEKKWFKKWRKKFPDDIKRMEKNTETPKEFENDLEKLDKRFVQRLAIPEEDKKLGVFTEYSEIEK